MTRHITLAGLLLIATACVAFAGPDLDRVLDYMFMDQMTGYKNGPQQFNDQRHITVTSEARIGQTFVTGPETWAIARIRTFLAPTEDWQPGEAAELTLWDSPEKSTRLASFTIPYENREFHYHKADWDLNVAVTPNTTYYFEINYAGQGDGKLGIAGAMKGADGYKSGQGYMNGKEADFDLCFEVHSRHKPDPIGNLKKMFARFDLDRPGLEKVKAAVEKEDFETAIKETVAYFESPARPYPIVNPKDIPQPKPDDFIKIADSLMNATWRQVDFTLYSGKKIFVNAYLATGDNKYAKKLNDLMLDWMVNSPPPNHSHIGGVPADPTWSSLRTGLRLGHAYTAYSRIHTSPAFTTDCRMAFIINLADHCDSLMKTGYKSGGNWSFTQNSALLNFGMNYPEFKMSARWADMGAQRLADSLRNDTLPDGPETESAFGYQRFSYRPLSGVYDDLILKRGLRTSFTSELGGMLEKQAEYFMYAGMPNGLVPYLGDWGHDDARVWAAEDSERFNRKDMLYVATAGKQGVKPNDVSRLYPCAGLAFLRSDWGDAGRPYEDSRYMLFHGAHYGGHGHADINAIIGLYAYGREILTDPGAFDYDRPEHQTLCHASSHNLLVVDGRNQDFYGPTMIRGWSTTPIADYVVGWGSLFKGPDATREVFYARSNGDPDTGDYWVVRDIVGGTGTYELAQRWHFVLDSNVTVDKSTLTARTGFPSRGNLAIMQIDPSRLSVEETTTDMWPVRGKFDVPPSKLPTVVYKTKAAVPAALDTLLLPYNGPKQPKLKLETIETGDSGFDSVFKVTQGSVTDLYALQRSGADKLMPKEKVAFCGKRVFVRRIKGNLRSAMLTNGSWLRVNGKEIVRVAKPLSWIAVSMDKDAVRVYTSAEATGLQVPIAKGRKLIVRNMNTDKLIDPEACKIPPYTYTAPAE